MKTYEKNRYVEECFNHLDLSDQPEKQKTFQMDSAHPILVKISGKGLLQWYRDDRIKKVSLKKVYIGNIYQITHILKDSLEEKLAYYSEIGQVREIYALRLVKEKALLLRSGHHFLDLETSQKIKMRDSYKIGDFYIKEQSGDLKSFASIIGVEEKEIPKSKVLEKYREYRER